MDGCREECVEWGRGDGGRYLRPSIQPHRGVAVSLPARLTYAVVDGDIQLRIELQSEAAGRGKRVALLAPAITALTTATDGTASLHAAHRWASPAPPKLKPFVARAILRIWAGHTSHRATAQCRVIDVYTALTPLFKF